MGVVVSDALGDSRDVVDVEAAIAVALVTVHPDRQLARIGD
jgi:hypothetical protein